MDEMVEPDLTIFIVSIIGLVIIWGSVLYHKFVQDGRKAAKEQDREEDAVLVNVEQGEISDTQEGAKSRLKNKKKNKRKT